MRFSRRPAGGALVVALGASLWGTDALFRRGLALDLSSVEVVFWEHLLLAVVSLALVLPTVAHLRVLDRRDWLAIGIIGGGSSVLATVLFTEAFKHGDPTTPLLLQKLQPIVAAGAAYVLLRERLRPRYFAYLAVALVGSYLVAFSDPGNVTVERLLPAALGAGAAVLWALGTVLGKHAGAKVPPAQLAGLRFLCGLPVAALLLVAVGDGVQATAGDVPAIVLLALVPGLAALLLYYHGLRRTTASAATRRRARVPAHRAGRQRDRVRHRAERHAADRRGAARGHGARARAGRAGRLVPGRRQPALGARARPLSASANASVSAATRRRASASPISTPVSSVGSPSTRSSATSPSSNPS